MGVTGDKRYFSGKLFLVVFRSCPQRERLTTWETFCGCFDFFFNKLPSSITRANGRNISIFKKIKSIKLISTYEDSAIVGSPPKNKQTAATRTAERWTKMKFHFQTWGNGENEHQKEKKNQVREQRGEEMCFVGHIDTSRKREGKDVWGKKQSSVWLLVRWKKRWSLDKRRQGEREEETAEEETKDVRKQKTSENERDERKEMGSTKAGARERFRKEGKRESRGNNTFPRHSSGALPS